MISHVDAETAIAMLVGSLLFQKSGHRKTKPRSQASDVASNTALRGVPRAFFLLAGCVKRSIDLVALISLHCPCCTILALFGAYADSKGSGCGQFAPRTRHIGVGICKSDVWRVLDDMTSHAISAGGCSSRCGFDFSYRAALKR